MRERDMTWREVWTMLGMALILTLVASLAWWAVLPVGLYVVNHARQLGERGG